MNDEKSSVMAAALRGCPLCGTEGRPLLCGRAWCPNTDCPMPAVPVAAWNARPADPLLAEAVALLRGVPFGPHSSIAAFLSRPEVAAIVAEEGR